MTRPWNPKPTLFLERTKQILQDKGYSKECYTLEDLANVIDETQKNVIHKVWLYKWLGLPILVLMPIISAFLSVIIAQKSPSEPFAMLVWLVPYMSFGLTVLTILNAIFKPGERFKQVCSLGIQVASFKDEVLSALASLSPVDDASLLKLVDANRKRFEVYQEQLIGLFLPEVGRS